MRPSSSDAMNDSEERAETLRALAARLGIAVQNMTLFDRALTHASVVAEANAPLRDYESLEFLGDAVLGLAVADYLFVKHPDRTPGEYSRMRAGVVSRRSVARVARELDIAPAIRLGKGEEHSGGRQRAALVADCLEALIGAVSLDCGWEAAQDFVTRSFLRELQRACGEEEVWDFKSRLQNYCQAERIALPEFKVIRSEGPDHRKEFEVEVWVRGHPLGRGRGSNKKEAEQNAAREALERVGLHYGQSVGEATKKGEET